MSRPGYPKTTARTIRAGGDYYGPIFPGSPDPQVHVIGDESANVLQTYDNAIGANSIGFPQHLTDNDYHRFHFENGCGTVRFNGDGNFSESLNLDYPCESIISNAGFNRHSEDGLSAMTLNASKITGRLIDQILDRQTNAAQMIAEREQTVNLITSTARRLAQTVLALKRGSWKQAVTSLTGNARSANRTGRALGGIPEQWLALQYGWKPLLSDIHGSCEELTRIALNEPPVLSAYATSKMRLDKVEEIVDTGEGSYYPGVKQYRDKGEIRGSGYLEYKLSSTFGQNLARTGLINPYTIAWELAPWSFVVDWFIPVGNFLTRLDFDTGLVFSRGYISQKCVDNWSSSFTRTKGTTPGVAGPIKGSWSGCNWKTRVTRFKRDVFLGSPPVPPPRFKNPFSLTHAANALSLMATAFDRPKNTYHFMK